MLWIHKLKSVLAIALGGLTFTSESATPNIVLVVADYMGYADIEPFGGKQINTPALNLLASKGTKFTNHYTSAPACIPARASLLSGKYPYEVLTPFKTSKGRGLHAEKNQLLSTLKQHDYRTAAIGKWHLGSEAGFAPNDHMLDYFFGFDDWALGYHDHKTSTGKPGLMRNKTNIQEDGYLTDLITIEAQAFIKQSEDRPFFLYLNYNGGLPPYQPPKLAKTQWHTGWEVEHARHQDYISMIESMDQGLTAVLSTLKQQSLAENTLVIFTYDHGGRHMSNSGPLFHGFGTLWEGGIRVPLIVRWPNDINGHKRDALPAVVDTPTIAMDITTTLMDLASGKENTDRTDGVNLIELMQSREQYRQRSLFWRARGMKAIRQGKWKYVEDGYTQFLFDLDVDQSERQNRLPQNLDVAAKLRQRLTKQLTLTQF